MTLFIDASAIVALMDDEPGSDILAERFDADETRIYSGLAHWEAALAIARKRKISVAAASGAVDQFSQDFAIYLVAIGSVEASLAVGAQQRYGKGTKHPARLNLGDCFAYACAKANNARLLYKGDDISKTDLG